MKIEYIYLPYTQRCVYTVCLSVGRSMLWFRSYHMLHDFCVLGNGCKKKLRFKHEN